MESPMLALYMGKSAPLASHGSRLAEPPEASADRP
jgi:hypothetical protein